MRKLENTDVYRTDLKQIFDFIRCSGDKERLKELVQTDPAYREMDEDAYDMAAAYADAEELITVKKYRGKDGKVDMCKGLKDWLEEERREGIEQGIQEGTLLQTISLARKKSKKGMSAEEIAELLEEDIMLIRDILKTVKSNPKADDREVARMLLK